MVRTWMALATAVLMLAMPAASLPTPGLNGETTEQIPVIGRLFPEPLHTNDYIGYFEAVESLETLNEEYPDRVELFKLGKSYGWEDSSGQRVGNDILHVEVTNEQSTVPFDNKIQLFFMCSIHGNEKGGREGCLRVIEDFAKGIGMAEDEELVKLLDYMVLIFNMPNTDGWTHDELEYYPYNTGPGFSALLYTRANANGTDLNRNWPTQGYMEQDQSHKTLAEPESAATANFAQDRYKNVWYASDIHGMLNPADAEFFEPPPSDCRPPAVEPAACEQFATEFTEWLQSDEKGHFLLSLLPAGQLTQAEQIRMTRLSELLIERTSANCGGGTLAASWCAAPTSAVAWGGNYNHWGTVWETIGYQVTGGSHDWMMGDHGLNAPSVSFEMSYNHIVCDGVYPGCGEYMNDFHVNTVRMIVATFMEAAKIDFQVSIESGGKTTGYLYNPLVVSNVDEEGNPKPSGGWADQNTKDDRWDVLHNTYEASPNDYLRDMSGYVINGDRPGVFDEVQASALTAERLAAFDNFIVAGSAYKQLSDDSKGLLKAWVEGGGNLVVTDEALQLVADLGVADAQQIEPVQKYVGYTEVIDYEHPVAKDLIGFSRQTYEPVPIGHQQGASPIWVVNTDVVREQGSAVGVIPPSTPGGNSVIVPDQPPRLDESPYTNLGEIQVGAGTIRFLGALVPDPTYEFYTPYGTTSYAVTYAGNQFFINLLGFDLVFQAPPLVLEDTGNLVKANSTTKSGSGSSPEAADVPSSDAPGPAAAFVVAALALAALGAAARRRRD